MTEKPLSGIRILDLTRFMAGPLGTQILQNLGAEVIKIEHAGKMMEFSRSTEPTFGGTSAYFIAINSGKKDLQLDLSKPAHREVFLCLAQLCDVVTENFRPGVTERLGVSYQDVKKVNPNVIYSSVSGFGQTGPYRDRGCVDTLAQAMSGFMSVTGEENGEAVRAGSSIADVCASLYEVIGILAAIISRRKSGQGLRVDVPMLSAMMTISDGATAEYLNHGTKIRKTGNRSRTKALLQTLPTRDGAVMVEAATQEHFSALAHALKLPNLLEDPDFLDSESRLRNIKKLESILFPITRQMTKTELASLFQSNGIPEGEVNTQEQICRSGYLEQAGLSRWVRDRKEGTFHVLGLPLKFDRFQIPEEDFVPEPGEHSQQVLSELLGMSEREIEELYQD